MGNDWEVMDADVSGLSQKFGGVVVKNLDAKSISCGYYGQFWVLHQNGGAWTRLEVDGDEPKGTTWLCADCTKSYDSISIGIDGQLWAVDDEGSMYWRKAMHQPNS